MNATELEAFAVVWALETFRVYIEGSPTLVRTDHSPLLWLRNHAGKSARIARWVLRLQEFSFDLQHRAGRCNAVADALSRYPTGEPDPSAHSTMFDAAVCAFVAEAERCQACWGPARPFLTRGGEGSHSLTEAAARERAKELVDLETDKGPGTSRPTLPPGKTTIAEAQALCHETLLLRQYLDNMPGAMLPRWVTAAGLRPVLRDGVLCLANMDPQATEKHERIHVPLQLRAPLVQRMHCGKFAGHFGRKKTLAKLQKRYIWGSMARDVTNVLKTCTLCWQYAKSGPKKLPLCSLPRGWPGEVLAMDLFGPLPKTPRGSTVILVFIDHFTRWVEPVALKKAEVSDVVSCLRDVWMPKHGVPAVLLSDNGPQFVAAVLRDFCASIGVRKIYSTPYHPQGNSVAESFMRTLKKGLSGLVAEDGRDWDLYLSAVALAHNSTPNVATGFSPFFLVHGREALLPVQRHLDEPRLDATARLWLSRLWKARVAVYEAQLWLEAKRKEVLKTSTSAAPVGALVMVRLTPQDKAAFPAKFAPSYMGPWVVVERFTNGITYRVRDLVSAQQRQLTRDQFKVVDLPASVEGPPDPNSARLPRLVVNGSGILPTETAVASEGVDLIAGSERATPPPSNSPGEQQAHSPATGERALESERRYGRRPVAA